MDDHTSVAGPSNVIISGYYTLTISMVALHIIVYKIKLTAKQLAERCVELTHGGGN